MTFTCHFCFLNENAIISDKQFGFRAKHSTIDQLLLSYNDVTSFLDAGGVADLIFFDFSKAFDRVSHPVLVQKLRLIGVDPTLVRWIEQYLSGRSMHVRVAGKLSDPVVVTSGVPQGSVLGPTLFLIYVNFVVSQLTCSYQMFADDLKLYLSFNKRDALYAVDQGQSNIDQLVRAGEAWGLKMNASKCVCIRFSRRGHQDFLSHLPMYKINNQMVSFVESHS